MKKLTFSKSKFESKIINHFEENGIYDYIEDKKDTFKLWFEETISGNTYRFDFEYCVDFIGVYYSDEVKCTSENKQVELTIKLDNNNPNKSSLYEVLQDIIEKQKSRDEENAIDFDNMPGGRDYNNDLQNMK